MVKIITTTSEEKNEAEYFLKGNHIFYPLDTNLKRGIFDWLDAEYHIGGSATAGGVNPWFIDFW